MNIWLAVGLIFSVSAGCSCAAWILGRKHGEKAREEEILRDYLMYISVGEIGNVAEELMEEEGLSRNFPMLIVMPDKYDYLDGVSK